MASPGDETVKSEPSIPDSVKLEQSTTAPTPPQEFSVTAKEEDESFELFYTEVTCRSSSSLENLRRCTAG